MRRRRNWLGPVFALAAVLPTLAGATPVAGAADLEVSPASVVIDPGTGATTWSAALRVVSSRHVTVAALPRGLVRLDAHPDATPPTSTPADFGQACAQEAVCVDAAAIKVEPATLELSSDVPAETVVSVAGPLRPGLYQGAVDFVASAIAEDASSATPSPTPSPPPVEITVALTVVVRGPAVLSVPQAALVARRVRVTWPSDNALALLLLSDAERSGDIVVPISNLSPDPVAVEVVLGAVGQATGLLLPFGSVTGTTVEGSSPCTPAGAPMILPNGALPALRVCLDVDQIEPDRYLGNIALTTARGAAPQVIPLDLTIREGPTVPLALILLGIGLSFFAKLLIGRVFPLADQLDRQRRLLRRISRLPIADQSPLRRLADEATAPLQNGDREGTIAALDRAEKAAGVLDGLLDFERRHDDGFANERNHIRSLVSEGLLDEAITALHELQVQAVPPLPPRGRNRDLGRAGTTDWRPAPGTRVASANARFALAAAAVLAMAVILLVAFVLAGPMAGLIIGGFAIVVVVYWAVRGPLEPAIHAHWLSAAGLLRPVFRVALIIGLAIVGIETLYVADGARLLAAPIDWAVVFVFWGLASDVASRTIVDFAKPG